MADEKILTPIRAFMTRSFEGRQVADDDDIFAHGFGNSLFAIQLVAFIENEFGLEIESSDMEMDNFRSVRAVSNLVERKLAAVAG